LPPTFTIAPGFAVDGTIDGEADAAAVAGALDADAGALADAGVEPPHALAASATTDARAANRLNLVLAITLLLLSRS
jgi:hypothetical protein